MAHPEVHSSHGPNSHRGYIESFKELHYADLDSKVNVFSKMMAINCISCQVLPALAQRHKLMNTQCVGALSL